MLMLAYLSSAMASLRTSRERGGGHCLLVVYNKPWLKCLHEDPEYVDVADAHLVNGGAPMPMG